MNRRVWLPAAIALVSVAALVIGVRVWVGVETQTPARKYLESVRVAGYQQLSVTNDEHDGSTEATGIFIGPYQSTGPLAKVITGPSLRLETANLTAMGITPQPTDQFDLVLDGESTPSICYVEVQRFRAKDAPTADLGLSAQQIGQVQAGTSGIIEVTVDCGTG